MARLFDCIMFNDELDMLQLRLEECDNTPVDWHVLVEAPVNHQGRRKPLYFAENKERFAPWLDKIIHVVAPALPESSDPWVRENAQRDFTGQGLAQGGAEDDDLVLLADCDEIPNMTALTAQPTEPAVLHQRCVIYAVDWLWPLPMKTSALMPLRQVYATGPGYATARINAQKQAPVIENAGMHLTWLGGPEAQLKKADSHCHIEFDSLIRADPVGFYERGTHPWRVWAPGDLIPVDVDETWPRMVYERRCPPNWFRPRP